MKKAKFYL